MQLLFVAPLLVSPLLVSPLCVVPTELTDHTEAYGLKVLESTERIDAARHTTEGRIDSLCSVAKGSLMP